MAVAHWVDVTHLRCLWLAANLTRSNAVFVRHGAEKKADGSDGIVATATKTLQGMQELMNELAADKPMVLAAVIGEPRSCECGGLRRRPGAAKPGASALFCALLQARTSAMG